jgi:NADPH2:quinone reductase
MGGMHAVVVSAHGGPEVLQLSERDDPVAGPGQIVVEVAAAGVNFMDIYQREGRPPYAGGTPFVPGAEGAGIVAETGPGVNDIAVGDRVAWSGVPGSYAQKVLVPAERAVPVPEGVDLNLAASTLLQGMTAHYLATSSYPVQSGDPVVVHAAAGGTGRLLVQIVKRFGGVVIATTSTSDKAELARSAGADHVTDYESFGAVAREVTDGAGVAAVYDGVGAATFDASLAALRPRGMMVLYGGSSGAVPPFELQRLSAGGSLYITRPTLVHFIATRAELLRRSGELFDWIARGELEVTVGATYPLAEAARAHDDLAARRTTGKLLLIPA